MRPAEKMLVKRICAYMGFRVKHRRNGWIVIEVPLIGANDDIQLLRPSIWKLIVSYYSNPYRKVYALVRYEVDRDVALLRRIPEHQNWSLSSDSPEELLLRIAAEMPDEFCFGTDHFNNFAPQSIRFENIRMIKLDSFLHKF